MALISKFAAYVAVLGIFFALISIGAFSQIRNDLTDRLYGGASALPNIIIIAIDDASINEIGQWPWSRAVSARLLNKLKDARAVGFDVSFFEPTPHDNELSAAITPNVVLAAEVQDKLYLPVINASSGYVNLITDSDGIARSIRTGLADIHPFAFEVYKKGWTATLPEGKLLINFVDRGTFQRYSVREVLASNISFAGKFVLIGATAPNLHDEYTVPNSNGVAMPGVEIHANILQNLILSNFLKRQPNWALILTIAILGALSLFFFANLRLRYTLLASTITILGYAVLTVVIFQQFTIILDLLFVPAAIIIFTAAGYGLNYREEREKTNYLRDAFSKYVSKDLLEQLMKKRQEIKLGGAKGVITVFFSDIRGFTTLSESISPELLVHILNEYFTSMTRIILAHGGTVDKFIGDAIMAFWNAPVPEKDHAELACASAIAQVKELRKLQQKWASEGLPAINIGCGINTGEAIIGNMGSEERFDYTAIGDTVNLASRLEGLTKEHKAGIIISQSTHDAVKHKFKCKKIGDVPVKGKAELVTIYELLVE